MNARTVTLAILIASAGFVRAAVAQDLSLPEPVGMSGDPAATLVLDGNAAFLHGDLATAKRDYELAIVHKHDFAVARFNLGIVEAHGGHRTLGLSDMSQGIALARRHGMSSAYVARLVALRSAFSAENTTGTSA